MSARALHNSSWARSDAQGDIIGCVAAGNCTDLAYCHVVGLCTPCAALDQVTRHLRQRFAKPSLRPHYDALTQQADPACRATSMRVAIECSEWPHAGPHPTGQRYGSFFPQLHHAPPPTHPPIYVAAARRAPPRLSPWPCLRCASSVNRMSSRSILMQLTSSYGPTQAAQVALLVCAGVVVWRRERMHTARRYVRIREQAGLP
jgi:hypothetical protein